MEGMKISRPRLYEAMVARHLVEYLQMVFLSGARQVGKTTSARRLSNHCLSPKPKP